LAVIGAVLLLIGAASPVAAQSNGFEVEPFYQFQHSSCSDCGDAVNFPMGFGADVTGMINPMWSWVGDLDFSRKSESAVGVDITETVVFFGAGARWTKMQASGIAPFVQFMIGAARDSVDTDLFGSDSQTKFGFDVDGGVRYPLGANNKTSLFGQIGYRRVQTDPGSNIIRLALGVSIKVGGQ
jgi:hypothetical protein